MNHPTPSRLLRGPHVLADPLVQELLASRLVAVLATFDAPGGIHAVPMWFAVDDAAIVLATGSASRKVANLRRNSLATVVVHDSRPGFEVCGVSVRGAVELVEGAEARPLVERVHRRYVDAVSVTDPSVEAFLASDDVALRLYPEQAFTWDERQSEASRALTARGGALPLAPTTPRYFGSGSSL